MSLALATRPTPSLRPYQSELIGKIRAEMRRGHKRVIAVSPTGSGKTITASSIVHSANEKGNVALWLSHRTELVEQACRTLYGFGLDVGCVAASSKWPMDLTRPVQVASIQTLLARGLRIPNVGLIVWDEAHHASEAAEQWASLLDAYRDVPLVGLTATPERGDGSPLAPLFTSIVVGATVRELTMAGHLVPCEVIRPGRMLESGQIAQDPVDAYREHGGGRQAILFAKSVEEAKEYATRFVAAGHRAECITAQTPQDTRDVALELFRRGAIRILTNVYVLTEGTDLPMAEVCILARGAASAGIFIQMCGRVLRPAPGKTSAMLIDLRGVSHVHGMPEEERLYSLEGKGISLAATRHCAICTVELEGSYPCSACGYAPDGKDVEQTTVVNEPLVKFARLIAQSDAQRYETLVRWVGQALAKGHKPQSVRYKWKHCYREDLSMDRLMRAVRAARGAG